MTITEHPFSGQIKKYEITYEIKGPTPETRSRLVTGDYLAFKANQFQLKDIYKLIERLIDMPSDKTAGFDMVLIKGIRPVREGA
jgi:hypothetical protein